MPCKKRSKKARHNNAEKAREARVQMSQDKLETHLEACNDLEIVEQSAFDHSNAQQTATEAGKEANPKKRRKSISDKTLQRRKKFREDLSKKGFPTLFKFMAHVKEKAEKKERMEQLIAKALQIRQVSESEESEELDTVESGIEELDSESVIELDTEDLVSKHMGQSAVSDDSADEEEEESEDPSGEEDGGHTPHPNGMQSTIQVPLLKNLGHGRTIVDERPPAPVVDNTLGVLRDRSVLLRAQEKLLSHSQDKSIDVVFRARILAMIGVLNLFLDAELSYTWKEASIVIAKAQGHGTTRVRSIRAWVLDFVREGRLPFHSYGYTRWTVLEDEDVLQEIQDALSEKSKVGFIKAQDVCDIVASENFQALFSQLGIHKPSISQSTAQRWLGKLNWRYSKMKNGMFIDGHEREDVVAYRQAFVYRWVDYEARFPIWDDNGIPLPCPSTLSNSRPLILVTHDESVFYQNDERKTCWSHQDSRPAPKPKGEGQSLMVSDFLTAEWGRLHNNNREARIVFKPGKNRDGYFDSNALIAQVDRAIDIFEGKVNGLTQGLFLFDNAPSHLKHAPDAISATKMVKNRKRLWTHHPKGPRMRDGINTLTGERQSFYFPDDHPHYPGWFKGMEHIIRERGLWPEAGLPVECGGPKRPEGHADCCCRHLLYTQPDFASQKPLLQEHIESHGHLCDYYPKYHCELNFIEQYWGAAKLWFRVAGRARTLQEMERTMLGCLDDIPLEQIRRFADRSARFISAYRQGLSGAQALWANKKYHSHRILPPDMVALVKKTVSK